MYFDEWRVSLEHDTGFHCYENTCNNQLTFYGLSSNFNAFADIYRNSPFANTGSMIYLMDTSETKIFSAFEDETVTLAYTDELISGSNLSLTLGYNPYDIYKSFKVRGLITNKYFRIVLTTRSSGSIRSIVRNYPEVMPPGYDPMYYEEFEIKDIFPNILTDDQILHIQLITEQTDSTKTGPADIFATKNGKFY